MTKIYFICMGNYYRSRLAEELTRHYARQHGIEVEVDSGGLSRIPNPNHPGTIAKATLRYLEQKQVQPEAAGRFPKNCSIDEVYEADLIVFTDKEEQSELFLQRFPDYQGQVIGWSARDIQYDPLMDTPGIIDSHVQALIQDLLQQR